MPEIVTNAVLQTLATSQTPAGLPLSAAAEAAIPTVASTLGMPAAEARKYVAELCSRETRRRGAAQADAFVGKFASALRQANTGRVAA